jgi:hypothetical protein
MVDTDGSPLTDGALANETFAVDVAGVSVPVSASLRAPYDPASVRVRS